MLYLTQENFEKETRNSELPIIIDFYASWCGPCMMMAPIFEELEDELKGKCKFYKINVDEEDELAIKFNAQSIPMFVMIKNNKVVGTTLGYQSKESLLEFIKKNC